MTAGLVNIAIGLLLLLLSLPLRTRRVPMNRIYGFRLKQSVASEENWYRINEYGARRMLLWSLVIIFLGGIALIAPFNQLIPFQRALLLGPLLIIVPAIETYLYAQQFS